MPVPGKDDAVPFVEDHLFRGAANVRSGELVWEEFALLKKSGYLSPYYKRQAIEAAKKYGEQIQTRQIRITIEVGDWEDYAL